METQHPAGSVNLWRRLTGGVLLSRAGLSVAGLILVALGAAALALDVKGSTRPTPPIPPPQPPAPAQPGPVSFGWRLTKAMAAHRGLVLEVETTRPAEALLIAQRLTELYQDRFDEVLVFIFEPGLTPRRALERVQWTRAHGYRTLTLRVRP